MRVGATHGVDRRLVKPCGRGGAQEGGGGQKGLGEVGV